MQLKLKNNQLKSLTEFINSLTFNTGSAHIAQARIVTLMVNKYKELDEDRIELVNQYANKDDNGDAVILDNGTADMTEDNHAKFNDEYKELFDSDTVIDLTEHEDKVHKLESALENYNRDLTGDQSLQLVAFLDAIKTKEND
ncbi:hypothetical protein LOOC260_109970 [Paucilactobacillus hokkaidonensis JCM 18461]|uniref:Phage protein n=2 Tax=Paucilactobacillus hokkaidonensis TaxID=1193095 RepID=A0A0A1GYI3_9LACO|nr:DUF1617 family protein [Paucilactobacillus hokkaidonensis]KRO09797.1 hypothetical protein IV59_GL000410 [Paucilactobacillus hokkaidonensis]BAP85536.1 hypothetical protein LOOC260_109970 [Paucilactobacillus hokkaidonensis JCM 18461]